MNYSYYESVLFIIIIINFFTVGVSINSKITVNLSLQKQNKNKMNLTNLT